MHTIENVVNLYLISTILVVLPRSTFNRANYSIKEVVSDRLDTFESLGSLTNNGKAA